MALFWQQAWFFTTELFKFMTMFYTVWVPGFFLAALLTVRFRRPTWKPLLKSSATTKPTIWRAILAGVVGSVDRKTSRQAAWELLKQGRSPATAMAYLITSRNMTIHFWAIFALSLGAEFAVGQVLGALVMITTVTLGLKLFPVEALTVPESIKWEDDGCAPYLPDFPSWRGLLLTLEGWWEMLKFIGGEVLKFAPMLAVGIGLGGIMFAAGLESWWFPFADIGGHHALTSDLINSLSSPVLSAGMLLSPVGNLPVIHSLFKADGLSYPGIISFCLASAIHPSDMRIYFRTFGRRQGTILVTILYGGAAVGGLGSTLIYAMFGFRPQLPPLELMKRFLEVLGF
jgi:hypothetical protein